jgi:hypothetical protein
VGLSQFGHCGEEANLLPLPGIEPQFRGRLTQSMPTVLSSLVQENKIRNTREEIVYKNQGDNHANAPSEVKSVTGSKHAGKKSLRAVLELNPLTHEDYRHIMLDLRLSRQ